MPAISNRIIHVLVVEDPASELHGLRDAFVAGPPPRFHIDHVASRAVALETICRHEHDVVLLATRAVDATALDRLREILAHDSTLPIILVTVEVDPLAEEAAMRAGAADCIGLAALIGPEFDRAIHRSRQFAATRAELQESRRQLAHALRDAPAPGEHDRTANLLHRILRNLPVIAGQLDQHARVVEAQGAGLLPPAIQPERLVGRIFPDLFPASQHAIREALAGNTATFTLTGTSSGQEWHAEFFVTFDASQPAVATFLGRDITERRWLEVNLLHATDAEQQRLGTDLHDGLGQHLTGLAFMAAALRDRLKASLPEEVPQAEAIARLAHAAVAQSRALARGLHPVQLDENGLIAALEELATQSGIQHGIDCRFQLRGPAPALPHSAELHLYRIAQEAIRNAIRHGAAQHVAITLVSTETAHRLTISDDGNGFNPAKASASTSARGLRLMRYRATMIGGALSVESRPGRGTHIACDFSPFFSHAIEPSAHADRSSSVRAYPA
jgi:signal transduction histidine kinase